MLVKDFRYRVAADPRGNITTGQRSEAGLPEKLDYFNVSDFPELIEMYGEKPAELVIYFPTDNPFDFIQDRYERWASKDGKSVLVRHCDRETCIHRISETVGTDDFGAGEESSCSCITFDLDEKKQCKRHMWMKAYVAHPKTFAINNPLTYFFDNHSRNSAENVISHILQIKDLNMGVLRNVPFRLSVRMVQDSSEAKKKFPIWYLTVIGFLDQIRESRERLLPKDPEKLPEAKEPTDSKKELDARLQKNAENLMLEITKSNSVTELKKTYEKATHFLQHGDIEQVHFDDILEALKIKKQIVQPI